MEWYLKVLKQYTNFKGRATRKEYWMFTLFNTIFLIIAITLDNIFKITISDDFFYGPFYILYALAVFIPVLAVSVRRLHDIGKSGWYYLIILIPLAGPIWFLVLMVTESQPDENEYDVGHTDNHLVEQELNDNGSFFFIKNSTTRDTMVLVVVIWMFLVRIFWLSIPKILENMDIIMYKTSWFRPLNLFMNLIWAFVPIVLAFVVKDKTKQLILIIIGVVYLIISLIDMISQF